jgi:hypothetical protein
MARAAFPLNWKLDERPQRFGWAPGGYVSRCHKCDEAFIGDKRAIHCADCAYAMPDPQPRVPCFMFGDLLGEFD